MHGGKGLYGDSSSVGSRAEVERPTTYMVAARCQFPACALLIEGRTRLPILLAMLVLTTGCGTEPTTPGQKSYIYTTDAGKEILTTLACGNTTDPCNERYRSVTITNNPSDQEFWQFEARIVVRANIGIPYGRRPQDFNVIGNQDQCETVRSRVQAPTESCKGPFYFRREPK
jgi:hypothetical protein